MSKLYVDEIHPKTTGGGINLGAGSIVQTQTLVYKSDKAQTQVSTNSTTSVQIGAGTPHGLVELAITPKFLNISPYVICATERKEFVAVS